MNERQDKHDDGMAVCEGGEYAVCVDEKFPSFGTVHQRINGNWVSVRHATPEEIERGKAARESCRNFWTDFGPAADEATKARSATRRSEGDTLLLQRARWALEGIDPDLTPLTSAEHASLVADLKAAVGVPSHVGTINRGDQADPATGGSSPGDPRPQSSIAFTKEDAAKIVERKARALTDEYCHGDTGPGGYTWSNKEAEWQVILLEELAEEFRNGV